MAEYTWQQRARYFALGALWAVSLSLAPVAYTLWDWVHNWSAPIDWNHIRILVGTCAGPALVGYWRKHKAELRMPPGLVIPPEFRPSGDKADSAVA